MGKIVLECAKNTAWANVVSTIDSNKELSGAQFDSINETTLKNASVAICFTQPAGALDTVKKLCAHKVKIVMATTGWEADLPTAQKIVQQKNGAMIFSANFSVGVLIFFAILKQTCQNINAVVGYDVTAHELHHNRKIDGPSGTLKKIGNVIIDNINHKKKIVTGQLGRALKKEEIHLGFARGGDIIGEHSVIFDSEFDSIILKHSAKNRKGFAIGALHAANWLIDKHGFFSEQDLINSFIKS